MTKPVHDKIASQTDLFRLVWQRQLPILYPLVGVIGSATENALFQFEHGQTGSERLGVFWRSLYFSVITFSTIGYGDHYPADMGARLLVRLESLAGAILIALFIFVLGRRTAR